MLGSKLDQIIDLDSGMTINKKLSLYLIKSTARKSAQHPGEIPPYHTSTISLDHNTIDNLSMYLLLFLYQGTYDIVVFRLEKVYFLIRLLKSNYSQILKKNCGDWKLTPPVKTIYQEKSLLANGEKFTS